MAVEQRSQKCLSLYKDLLDTVLFPIMISFLADLKIVSRGGAIISLPLSGY